MRVILKKWPPIKNFLICFSEKRCIEIDYADHEYDIRFDQINGFISDFSSKI